jgi:hypothetical protein
MLATDRPSQVQSLPQKAINQRWHDAVSDELLDRLVGKYSVDDFELWLSAQSCAGNL